MKSKLNVLPATLLLLTLASVTLAADGPKYRVTEHFAIGGEGGWDYLSFDPGGGRLFATRGTHVMVIDPATGKTIGDIPETPGVHGVAVASDLGLGITSNGRGGSVSIFDLETLKKRGDVKVGNGPDAILYDPFSHNVFAFNGRSLDATVVDPATASVVATIPLGGKPESADTDRHGHVFVNIEDQAEIVEIDVKKNSVMEHWPLKGCEEPTGLAIDSKNNRLFSTCANQVMVILDTASGKPVATAAIGKHPDAAAFDPDTQLAFSSNGDGTLTVVHEDSPEKYTVVQNVATAVGARTLALDPKSHKIYLVTAKFGATPEPTAEQPRPRPAMVPGSFEMLVVSQQ